MTTLALLSLLSPPRLDPLVDPLFEHIERQRSIVDERVMELPDIESVPERSLLWRAAP